ncbi:methyl-accepting chemotaxis protein [Tropicibacter naphthalenivorans]|uniref:Uncharacterized protein n=1 Tax=Tropicibacter naphthalenivorans TaxID=441103 RepID=A0A0P1G9Z2_9RHOB|nr:methyl-accepting chemotaxis protein [Tropicibacter naphthalenivorans]CUH78276.1 hypothetical protein TRN7648_01890 [Tropicibacter naphthalenivorans]SMC78906.1 hypothetical protein SAMN04488093_10452 [Tropicibacter naphthalenivorans]
MHESFRRCWIPELQAVGAEVFEWVNDGFEPMLRSVYGDAIGMDPADLPAEVVEGERQKGKYILSGDFDTGYAELEAELIQGIAATGIEWQAYMSGYANYQAGITALAMRHKPDAKGRLRPPPYDLTLATKAIQLGTTGDSVLAMQYYFDQMEAKATADRKALLDRLFAHIGEDTQALSFSSTELSGTFDSLALAAESQAASLEENSAALTELEERVKATATDARGAAEQAQTAVCGRAPRRTRWCRPGARSARWSPAPRRSAALWTWTTRSPCKPSCWR